MAKKIIVWLLVVVLTAGIAVGGTLAYLTDRDSEANVFTSGDVDITLDEEFVKDSQLKPGVGVNKDVQIKNEGPNAAWVWYTYAVPANLDAYVEVTFADSTAWKKPVEVGVKTVDNVGYKYYAVLHNAPVAAGETTVQSMDTVTLSGLIDVAPNGDLYAVEAGVTTPLNWNLSDDHVIYVDAYAIQVEGIGSVEEAYNAFQDQWGGDLLPSAPSITVANADELADALSDPDLVPGTVIDGGENGVTVVVENGQQYAIPGGVTLKNITWITKSGGNGDSLVVAGDAGDTVVFENCTIDRPKTSMTIIASKAGGPNFVFNNCTFKGMFSPNFTENPDGVGTFNNCTFVATQTDLFYMGYVVCMGGTSNFNGCTFDYTDGFNMSSGGVTKANAVNSLSESYSTEVILNGCTLINCSTYKNGDKSTLTVK